ncbi:hypothetical protein C1646_776261 [Rhizophagus diaphanus]|nr:hypothetical protein C1646_776261 [Rhizophagus diaphanus] [Rhizophagus sp. MUCL 43196]
MNFEGDNNNAYGVELDVSFEHESDIDNANGNDGISLNYEGNNDNADGIEFDDDISFEYEDDNDGVEFDGDARDSSENIDSYNDNNNNSKNILENSSLPNSSFNGEFGPYFSSSTSASIFAWITKHMISTSVYEDLIKILSHPNFNVKEVPTNIRHFKKSSQSRLPLLTIKKHDIPISSMKTPSTSQPFREAYTVSLIDTIAKILSNPFLASKMYNGPEIEVENKSEFWHGELWQQSPLFGEHNITINSVEYFTGDFVHIMASNQLNCMRIISIVLHEEELKLKLQRFLSVEELSGRLKMTECSFNSNTRWLLEDKPTIVDPKTLIGKISVWLQDQPEPPNYLYTVAGILYNYQNVWKIRNIHYRIRHPSEYCPFPQNPYNLPVKKIFIDLYYDDFGTFRNVYHSLDGIYIQIGNMPFSLRKLLKNHFVIRFVLFGGKFKDFIHPFLKELRELEKEKVFNIQGKKILVIARLGLVTADLPQGNDLAGVMRHNAKKGCRSCKIENHDSLKSFEDLSKELRYHHLTNYEFENILNSDSQTSQKILCSEFGLKNKKPDIYHSIAGKVLRLMDCTFGIFNTAGNDEFIKNWKVFEMPTQWHKLPNPITHRQSFMMSDRLRLVMVLPYILRRFLQVKHLKSNSLLELQENLSVNSKKVVDKLIQCWVIVAKCAKFCFNLSFNNESYETLNILLKQETTLLTRYHAKPFSTLVNSSVGIKEMVHRTFKGAVPHTNGKMIEKDLIKRYNTLQALCNIIDGSLKSRYNNHLGCGYFQDNVFRSLLSSWYTTSASINDTKEIVETVDSPNDSIYEIRLQVKWKRHEILQNNFEINMSVNGDIHDDLKIAYRDYFNFTEYIHNNKLNYYNYISYKILDEEGESSTIQIHVGDIVEIEVENDGISYVIVKAIFLHTYNNNKTYSFYYLNWFEKIEGKNGFDNIMMGQKYKICVERKKWINIFPIHLINLIPKIHFIHQCDSSCLIGNHNLSQPYLLNEFFYNAV